MFSRPNKAGLARRLGHRRLQAVAATAAAILLALYLAVVGFFWANQRNFLFAGDPTRVAPAAAGLADFSEIRITTPDGERLVAWWRPPPTGAGAVLYFHGNGGSLAGRVGRFRDMADAGLGVLALSYRSYGGSSGRPSEAALVNDASLALDWLAQRADPTRKAVMGESLGTGVALALAAERTVGGLVLDSPYASIERVMARLYPWLPVGLLVTDRFDSEERVTRVAEPILVVHCLEDGLIPISEGRRLAARARPPAEVLPVAGCGHAQTWGDAAARARMLAALSDITAALEPPPAPSR